MTPTQQTAAPYDSKLHIPQASSRPGDIPNFSQLKVPVSSTSKKPPLSASGQDMTELAYGLVRVLDDDGNAVGPWRPKISPQRLREGLRHMLNVRAYDERMFKMQRQGKLSFYMKSSGEEAIAVAQAMALKPRDMLFPSYRQQGLLFVRQRPVVDMMCHCISNAKDNLKGRQMPVFYSWKEGNFFSISGNLSTQYSQAVGWAMASAYKGEEHIASAWVGDGSTAESDVHHAMLFASTYKAPIILNVVNNQWAISTFQGFAGGERRPFAARGIGLGIPGIRVDGNDLLAVYAVTVWAADRARRGGGPTIIELVTYRGGPHSTSDDPSKYRPKDEWADFPLGDPVERLKQHLIAEGHWSDADHEKLEEELRAEVLAAWKEAQQYGTMTEEPFLDPAEMFDDVYAETPEHLEAQREQMLALES